MSCDTHADALMGYLYGELDPDEARVFLEHARTCKTCGPELEEMQGLRRVVSQEAPLPEPHAALTARILGAARKEAPAAATAAAAKPSVEQGGFFGWLMKPWTVGIAVVGASMAAVLLVGSDKMKEMAKAPEPAPAVTAAAPQAAPPAEVATGVAFGQMEQKKAEVAAAERKEALEGAGGDGIGKKQDFAGRSRGKREATYDDDTGVVADKRADEKPRSNIQAGEEARDESEARPEERLAAAAPPVEKQKLAQEEPAAAAKGRAALAQTKDTPKPFEPDAEPMAGFAAAAPPPADAPNVAPASAPRQPLAARPVPKSPLSLPSASTAMRNEAPAGAAGNAAPSPAAPPPPAAQAADAETMEMDRVRPAAREAPKKALQVPGLARRAKESAPMAEDINVFNKTKNELQAQAEMAAGAEALASNDPVTALAAFRRAGQLDSGRVLGGNPKAGEAAALARSGQCGDALTVARGIARSYPAFGRRGEALREASRCYESKGDALTARAIREEADTADKQVATARTDPANVQATRVIEARRTFERDSAAVARCEQIGHDKGELPRAAGQWNVTLTIAGNGKVSAASARGPHGAPALAQCLEKAARGLVLSTVEVSTPVSVTVPVKVHAKPRALPRNPAAGSEAAH